MCCVTGIVSNCSLPMAALWILIRYARHKIWTLLSGFVLAANRTFSV